MSAFSLFDTDELASARPFGAAELTNQIKKYLDRTRGQKGYQAFHHFVDLNPDFFAPKQHYHWDHWSAIFDLARVMYEFENQAAEDLNLETGLELFPVVANCIKDYRPYWPCDAGYEAHKLINNDLKVMELATKVALRGKAQSESSSTTSSGDTADLDQEIESVQDGTEITDNNAGNASTEHKDSTIEMSSQQNDSDSSEDQDTISCAATTAAPRSLPVLPFSGRHSITTISPRTKKPARRVLFFVLLSAPIWIPIVFENHARRQIMSSIVYPLLTALSIQGYFDNNVPYGLHKLVVLAAMYSSFVVVTYTITSGVMAVLDMFSSR